MRGLRWAVIALLILTSGAEAAPKWFPLDRYRVEIVKGPITIRQYRTVRPGAALATTTTYSNRKGAPAGLLVVGGHVWKGSTRTRCILQTDSSGRVVRIGYALHRPYYNAFEAGPCLLWWGRGPHRVVAEAIALERIPKSFADLVTERSVLCVDRSYRLIAFRMRGSLWSVAAAINRINVELRCINVDGGSQLALNAVNPAVLGIVPIDVARR